MGMRYLGGLFTDGLCTGAVIGKLLWQLMLKVSEGDLSLRVTNPFWPDSLGGDGNETRNITHAIYNSDKVNVWTK